MLAADMAQLYVAQPWDGMTLLKHEKDMQSDPATKDQDMQAACVDARGSAAGSVSLCTWADGDTFGVVASPTMGLSQLAAQMRAIRPSVERPAR